MFIGSAGGNGEQQRKFLNGVRYFSFKYVIILTQL